MKQSSVEAIHILLEMYIPIPSKVFDEMLDIEQIVDCADSITENYDKLIEYNDLRSRGLKSYDEYEHKKTFMALFNECKHIRRCTFLCKFCM